VVSIIGGFLNNDMDSSSKEEDFETRIMKANKAFNWLIASIIGGLSSSRGSSCGTVKRRIMDMLSAEVRVRPRIDRPIL
jgi:hypothetical protein